ncbi:MAG: TetR/AcrR family transcriptional regulator [Myxococcota bacterium]|nr:TetR/AcrR family transcriptional regulator [Myxococcota bacterium]
MRPRTVSDEEILETARTCILEEGPSVSTQIIANQLGISQATLFKRFGNKFGLLKKALLLPIQVAALLKVLEKEADLKNPKEQLLLLGHKMHAFFDQMVPCWSAMHAAGIRKPEALSEDAPPIRVRKAIQKWIEALQNNEIIEAKENAETISIAFIGALQTRSFRRHIIRDVFITESDEAYLQDLVNITWRALSPKEDR